MSTWVFDKPLLKNERRESVTSRKTRKGKGEEERKKEREGGREEREKKIEFVANDKIQDFRQKNMILEKWYSP